MGLGAGEECGAKSMVQSREGRVLGLLLRRILLAPLVTTVLLLQASDHWR